MSFGEGEDLARRGPGVTSGERETASDYGFLHAFGLDAVHLREADISAARWGVPLHAVLIADGRLAAEAFAQAAAVAEGVAYLAPNAPYLLGFTAARRWDGEGRLPGAVMLERMDGERREVVLDPAAFFWGELRHQCQTLRAQGVRVFFTSARGLRRVFLLRRGAAWLARATDGLARVRPDLSARRRSSAGQMAVLLLLLAGIGTAAVLYPWASFYALSFVLSLAFFAIVLLRAYALLRFFWQHWRGDPGTAAQVQTAPVPMPVAKTDGERGGKTDAACERLPVYTLLVPLLHEAELLPGLMAALARLDYPPSRLDIKLVLEACDPATIAAARALDLPGNVDIIVVPDVPPRTKPKALNYALNFARGDYVVVFDAEDRPEPHQLREALHAFRVGADNLACVQARLNCYNPHENWFTRQFTIEYSSLFDAVLPALERLALPIPLGGTSNHFRMDLLRRAGGWDSYNVTEDADLGMRLARLGLQCGTLAATTYEEACARPGQWLRQRTRWLKGWMQTYLVHMRHPIRLLRDLGGRRFWAFQVLIGAQIVSALAHPLFMGVLAVELLRGGAFLQPESVFGGLFWGLALFNLGFGYLVSMALGALTLRVRGLRGLFGALLFMPVYWFLVSFAAYRALWQFLRRPHEWEKTEHRAYRGHLPDVRP